MCAPATSCTSPFHTPTERARALFTQVLDKQVFRRADDTAERARVEIAAFFSNPKNDLKLMREIKDLFTVFPARRKPEVGRRHGHPFSRCPLRISYHNPYTAYVRPRLLPPPLTAPLDHRLSDLTLDSATSQRPPHNGHLTPPHR